MTHDELAALLKSRKTEDRIRAVGAMARRPNPEQTPLLVEALRDRSHYVAANAAKVLRDLADEAAAPALLERFDYLMEDGPKRDPGCDIRTHLAFAFGRLVDYPAAAALRKGIRAVQIEHPGGTPCDMAAQRRANCALALAELRTHDALREIAPLLFDTGPNRMGGESLPLVNAELRREAARALARLATTEAVVPLIIRLAFPGNEKPEVLAECMEAVVALEDTRAVEILQPYLRHSDQSLAAHAALMIARTRAPEAAALLRDLVPRLSEAPLQAVLLGLLSLRTDEAFAVLRDLAKSEREAVRLALAEALTGSYADESRALLQTLSQDKSLAVKNMAKRALEE